MLQSNASTDPIEHRALATRLHVVARTLSIDSVLARCLLQLSTTVPTAAWVFDETKRTVEILVHPDMLRVLPDDELQALLMHEVAHLTGYNGLVRLRGLHSAAANLAFDIALERILSQPESPYRESLARLNDRLLLRGVPDEGPIPYDKSVVLLVHSRPPLERMPQTVRGVWQHLWSSEQPPSPEEAFQAVYPLVCRLPQESTVLLELAGGGDVKRQPDDELTVRELPLGVSLAALSQSVQDALRRALESLAEEGSWLRETQVTPNDLSGRTTRSVRAFVSSQQELYSIARCLRETLGDLIAEEERRPWLIRPTRRELTRIALAIPSTHYVNESPLQPSPLAVYVDVSASMDCHLSTMLGLLKAIEDLLPSELYAFDTQIKPVATKAALTGRIFSGGGTSFDAVAQHVLEAGIRDALVFTDGESSVSRSLRAELQKVGSRLRAVLFGSQTLDQPWWYATHVLPGHSRAEESSHRVRSWGA